MYKATQGHQTTKIIKNTDGSVCYVVGSNVTLKRTGDNPEIIEVEELDIEKALKDKKYVNDLVNSSKIKEKNKHGT